MVKMKRGKKNVLAVLFIILFLVLVLASEVFAGVMIMRSCEPQPEEVTVEGLQVQIKDLNNQLVALQTQLAQLDQPYILVTSPNGGEVWVFGETYDITWISGGVENIDIYLWFPDGATGLLADNVPASQGKYTLTLQENQNFPNISKNITAGQYKILIWSIDDLSLGIGAPRDYTDNFFGLIER